MGSLGPMPGLDLMFYEAVLAGVVLFLAIVLGLTVRREATDHEGVFHEQRHAALLPAVLIAVLPPAIVGFVSWAWGSDRLQHPGDENSLVSAQNVLHTVAGSMLASVILSLLASVVFLYLRLRRLDRPT